MPYNTNPYYLGNYSNPYLGIGAYNQIYQPQQQLPQMQPQQQQAQTGSIIWVNSLEEAQMYPVAPNAAVTLWQTTEPVVYLKQTDASGKPVITTYDLVERKQKVDEPKVAEVNDTYVTKESFAQVLAAITDIKDELTIIKDDIYGIAGKKKVATHES